MKYIDKQCTRRKERAEMFTSHKHQLLDLKSVCVVQLLCHFIGGVLMTLVDSGDGPFMY